MGTADAIASVLAITKLRVKLGQNSSLKRSQSHAKQQNLKLHVRLGQCYVKLHHGTVLGMLSLLLLAGLKFALQTVLQCSLAPHCQSLRPDCIIELSWAISSFIVYMMQSCPRKWVKIRPGGGEQGVLWEMREWRMKGYGNNKSRRRLKSCSFIHAF